MAVTATMKRPETVALTYDKADPVAKKTLNFFLSLGVFQIQKTTKTQIETGLEESRNGKYTVINRESEQRKHAMERLLKIQDTMPASHWTDNELDSIKYECLSKKYQ